MTEEVTITKNGGNSMTEEVTITKVEATVNETNNLFHSFNEDILNKKRFGLIGLLDAYYKYQQLSTGDYDYICDQPSVSNRPKPANNNVELNTARENVQCLECAFVALLTTDPLQLENEQQTVKIL